MNDPYTLLPLLLVVVVFYLLVLRPARARQRDFQSTQSSLEVGSRVMLASGIYGDVVELGEDTIGLQVAPGTVVTAARQAVARVVPPPTLDEPTDPAA